MKRWLSDFTAAILVITILLIIRPFLLFELGERRSAIILTAIYILIIVCGAYSAIIGYEAYRAIVN